MSPSENEISAKRSGIRPQPLCLFYFPAENTIRAKNSYVKTIRKGSEIRIQAVKPKVGEFDQKDEDARSKRKEEFWLRKRTEARIRRRRMRDPVRNLKTYLLGSEKNANVSQKRKLPSLFEVLEIVKDAWPSPSFKKKVLNGQDEHKSSQFQCQALKPKMKDQKLHQQYSPQLLHRRFSMPEELMRKFSISKERTSEDSETNKTTVEKSPSSSSTEMTDAVRNQKRKETQEEPKTAIVTADAYQQTSDSEQPKKSEFSKRVTQHDYYNHGKQIIKVKVEKECTCIREMEEDDSTTGSPKEETDDSPTSDSLRSSSPIQLPKRESSSGNLSSDSDYMRCTCAELTSTSTDLFRSGKSTLSQTISDKSVSTQDSTVSINSVSTGGSTVSDNSDTTTPEKKTSAKETTTSPDYSPTMLRNRKNRKWQHDHKKTCPRYVRSEHPKCRNLCPVHSEYQHGNTINAATNTDFAVTQETKKEIEFFKNNQTQRKLKGEQPERYEWARLSREELYMMQQLRHRRFVENQRQLLQPLLSTSDAYSLSLRESDTTYKRTENLDEVIMIPRYSALPRTLSMLVNTSSPDISHNSDSDNQSLADSLEDQPITHTHKLYFDTKKESKPVRGDASIIPDNKPKPRQKAMPKGRAFFVSIKDPYGEDEMLESIDKIPQPPEKIKNQIFKRHLSLCSKHQHVHENKTKGNETIVRKKKERSEGEDTGNKKKEGKKFDRECENKSKINVKGKKDKSRSKIPVLASSRSTSTSPEREPKEKIPRPKIRLRREKQSEELADIPKPEIETTQILEITQTRPEIILQKPQAVIHPSVDHNTDQTIPPLTSTLRIPPFRQLNKHFLLPARRSPIGKFRQRFEVIPEEKSSSLSSAEEKNPKDILPKFTDASTSPLSSEKMRIKNYVVNDVSNIIVADFTKKQLENLPYVNNDGQKIFLLSKSQNSTKGRDSLIAMNREDFNRLAKGWMNFYKLNELADTSENYCKRHVHAEEKKTEKEVENPIENKPKQPELEEPARLHSSNTILKAKSVPMDRSTNPKMQTSLPEWELPKTMDSSKTNPRVDEESDSDSTDYMEPPSPRVPPLPIGDIPSDATLSSEDSDLDDSRPQVARQMLKELEFKKFTTKNKLRPRKENFDSIRCGKKKNSGWSVTVAGTVELSRSAPDLEMRLSFPVKAGPPVVSQSDSGFAEDSNCSKLSESLDDLKSYTTRQALPLSSGNRKQQWMVTVKNHKKRPQEQPDQCAKNLPLPVLDCDRSGKKDFKDEPLEKKLKRIIERKIWPKVKKVIQKEFLTGSGRIFTEVDFDDDESCLSVIGSAVSLERKQKPSTMTERDVTRRYTSRTEEH